MNSSLRNRVAKNATPRRKRTSTDNSKMFAKRKSLRLQHSMSLHIPIEELENTTNGMNCYIEMPQQVFSLTYLEANETQNPDSLVALEELKNQSWHIYLVGYIYNFNYKQSQMNLLVRNLNSAINTHFQHTGMTYRTEMTVAEHLNPTENDNQALVLTVTGELEEREVLLYKGYMLSWCNPVQEKSFPLLPILLCRGNHKYRTLIHSVLSENFDVPIEKMILTQDDFMNLSTYCLIMLQENDDYVVKYCYKISKGTIKFSTEIQYLLKIWNTIHKSDCNEVELDEILQFHAALDFYYERAFGITLGCAHFHSIIVKRCFSLFINAQMRIQSTKILHVALKYFNYMAIQKLKVNRLDKKNTSVISRSRV